MLVDSDGSGSEELLGRAGRGDRSALGRLLERHRLRLERLVAARLDRRLRARGDPADIVQDALIDAERRLPAFLRDRSVGFFPWLRQLTLHRLVWWHRFHIRSSKRSVTRELDQEPPSPNHSAPPIAGLVPDRGASPSRRAIMIEECELIQVARQKLSTADREILELRTLENLSFPEIADRLEIGLSAVKMRHLRALERLGALLNASEKDSSS